MKVAFRATILCVFLVLGYVDTASAQTYAGPQELNNCTIPTRILFSNNGGIKRFVQYPGGALNEMLPRPGYSTGKNWNMDLSYAPANFQNCSNGGPGGTQWLTFRLKTTNYFSYGILSSVGSGAWGHLAFGLRFLEPTANSYDGIGMILMPQYGGMTGERFRVGMQDGLTGQVFPLPPNQIPLQDGVEYAVVIHATSNYTSFSLTNVATGATTGFVGGPNPPNYPPVNNTGLAFDTLCSGGNASCENWNATPWSVDISSISSGWF
jgi:hypothetical protein